MVRKLIVLAVLAAASIIGPSVVTASAGGPYSGACSLKVSPPQFRAGRTVLVKGSDFQPNFTTKLILTSDPVVLGSVTTDAAGSFSIKVVIPRNTTPGDHTISADCDSTGVTVGSTDVEVRSAASVAGPGTTPRTGTDVEPYVVTAIASLIAGTVLMVIARRRRGSVLAG